MDVRENGESFESQVIAAGGEIIIIIFYHKYCEGLFSSCFKNTSWFELLSFSYSDLSDFIVILSASVRPCFWLQLPISILFFYCLFTSCLNFSWIHLDTEMSTPVTDWQQTTSQFPTRLLTMWCCPITLWTCENSGDSLRPFTPGYRPVHVLLLTTGSEGKKVVKNSSGLLWSPANWHGLHGRLHGRCQLLSKWWWNCEKFDTNRKPRSFAFECIGCLLIPLG